MMSGQDVPSRFQVQVLNYTDGETTNYPFVLLECKTAVLQSQSLVTSTELCADNNCSSESRTAVFENESVLVETASNCRSWTALHGGFKALVQLNPGKNLIRFKVRNNGRYTEQNFTLIYVPSNLRRFVRVVYIKCCDSDGSFQAPPGIINDVDVAIKKLAFNARLLQTFTAQDMNLHGFGHKTFRLDEDSEGKPIINVFTSSITAAEALEMTGGQLYEKFATELTKSSLYSPLCKFWAFMSCTHYDPPPPEEFNDKDIFKYVKAHTALGGGHLALFGTGNLHTWASDVDELVSCFTDTKMVDRQCLFDDSAKRGSYWANYATGLGASMHELGHCFDLAHTPGGIMGRGFDDFNCVFSLWKNPTRMACEESNTDVKTDLEEITRTKVHLTAPVDDIPHQQTNIKTYARVKGLIDVTSQGSLQAKELSISRDNKLVDWTRNHANYAIPGDWSHGAKWFRSSAVILNHHKWFNDVDDADDKPGFHPIVHWSRHFYGPVGNMSDSYNCNNTCFNDKTWLTDNQAVLCGYVIHADVFINSIQTIGQIVGSNGNVVKVQEIFSEPHGRPIGRKYIFKIDKPDEFVTAIDVRSGAWIDAIRIHTNYKSSILMGGGGGCMSLFEPSEGQRITGLFGRAGDYVGSLGISLESSNGTAPTNFADENLIIVAPNGLRLIELHDKNHGEVYKHWEFLEQAPPTRFTLNRDEIIEKQARIVVIDDKGNMHSSGPFCNLSEIFATNDTSSETQGEWKKKLEKSPVSSIKEIMADNAIVTTYEQNANTHKIEGSKEQEITKSGENSKEENTLEQIEKERSQSEKKALRNALDKKEITLTNEKNSHELLQKKEQNLCNSKVQSDVRKDSPRDVTLAENGKDCSDTEVEQRTVVEKESIAEKELTETEPHKTKPRQANRCKGEETVSRYY